MCDMSRSVNLVQNYSDYFCDSQRNSLSPTEDVKSTSSNYRKWLRNLYEHNNNIYMNNKNNNHDTSHITASTMTQTPTRASCTREHGT